MPQFFAFGPHEHDIKISLRGLGFGANAFRMSGVPVLNDVPFQIGPMKGRARLTTSPNMNATIGEYTCDLELVLIEDGEGVDIATMLEALIENMEVERGSDAARD